MSDTAPTVDADNCSSMIVDAALAGVDTALNRAAHEVITCRLLAAQTGRIGAMVEIARVLSPVDASSIPAPLRRGLERNGWITPSPFAPESHAILGGSGPDPLLTRANLATTVLLPVQWCLTLYGLHQNHLAFQDASSSTDDLYTWAGALAMTATGGVVHTTTVPHQVGQSLGKAEGAFARALRGVAVGGTSLPPWATRILAASAKGALIMPLADGAVQGILSAARLKKEGHEPAAVAAGGVAGTAAGCAAGLMAAFVGAEAVTAAVAVGTALSGVATAPVTLPVLTAVAAGITFVALCKATPEFAHWVANTAAAGTTVAQHWLAEMSCQPHGLREFASQVVESTELWLKSRFACDVLTSPGSYEAAKAAKPSGPTNNCAELFLQAKLLGVMIGASCDSDGRFLLERAQDAVACMRDDVCLANLREAAEPATDASGPVTHCAAALDMLKIRAGNAACMVFSPPESPSTSPVVDGLVRSLMGASAAHERLAYATLTRSAGMGVGVPGANTHAAVCLLYESQHLKQLAAETLALTAEHALAGLLSEGGHAGMALDSPSGSATARIIWRGALANIANSPPVTPKVLALTLSGGISSCRAPELEFSDISTSVTSPTLHFGDLEMSRVLREAAHASMTALTDGVTDEPVSTSSNGVKVEEWVVTAARGVDMPLCDAISQHLDTLSEAMGRVTPCLAAVDAVTALACGDAATIEDVAVRLLQVCIDPCCSFNTASLTSRSKEQFARSWMAWPGALVFRQVADALDVPVSDTMLAGVAAEMLPVFAALRHGHSLAAEDYTALGMRLAVVVRAVDGPFRPILGDLATVLQARGRGLVAKAAAMSALCSLLALATGAGAIAMLAKAANALRTVASIVQTARRVIRNIGRAFKRIFRW